MASFRIKTPLLRWLACFYGNLCIQLYPVSFSNLLNVLQNLLLNLAVHYVLLFSDLYQLQYIIKEVSIEKPFFVLMVDLCITYALPLSSLAIKVYYFGTGRRILRLLDSTVLRAPFEQCASPSRQRCTLLIILAVNGLHFATSYGDKCLDFLASPKTGFKALQLFAAWTVVFNAFIELEMLHYFQFATRYSLKQIEQHLLGSVQNTECKALEKIQTLARLNSELFTLLSLPLAVFLLIHIIDIIVVVCVLIFLRSRVADRVLVFILYLTAVCLYATYIVRLNQEIQKVFARICGHLRQRHLQHLDVPSTVGPWKGRGGGQLRQVAQLQHRHRSHQSRTSCQLRLYELAQYREQFKLRLFHLTDIDLSVFLSVALIMLGYIVFVAQTN